MSCGPVLHLHNLQSLSAGEGLLTNSMDTKHYLLHDLPSVISRKRGHKRWARNLAVRRAVPDCSISAFRLINLSVERADANGTKLSPPSDRLTRSQTRTRVSPMRILNRYEKQILAPRESIFTPGRENNLAVKGSSGRSLSKIHQNALSLLMVHSSVGKSTLAHNASLYRLSEVVSEWGKALKVAVIEDLRGCRSC